MRTHSDLCVSRMRMRQAECREVDKEQTQKHRAKGKPHGRNRPTELESREGKADMGKEN